jgi:hypothetical protein
VAGSANGSYSGSFYIYDITTQNTRLVVSSSGNLLVGTTTDAGFKLDVNGTGRFSGDLTANSNAFFGTFNGNDKYHFEPFTNAAGGANNAYLVSGKADNNERSGFILQSRNSNGEEYNAFILEGYSSTATNTALHITSTGAATFSSSVTANGLNALGSTLNNGNAIRFYRAGLTEMAYIGWSNENTNNSTWLFKSTNGNPIGFIADGTTQALTLTTTNNILVGTTTDSGSRLNVNGRIQGQEFFSVGSLNDTDGSFLIDHPGVQTWKIGITNNNSSTFSIGNDNGGSFAAKYFNITNSGNVGIGTTSPGSRLSISGDASQNIGLLNINNTRSTGLMYPALQIINDRGNHSYGTVAEFRIASTGDSDRPSVLFSKGGTGNNWSIGMGVYGGGHDNFSIGYRPSYYQDAWATSYLSITTGGNVLIGTTTDNSNKLRVNGVGFFDQGVRTGQPVGTTTNNWLLGRALASGTSTPDRWIRVQIGLEYYDILAVYMGTL